MTKAKMLPVNAFRIILIVSLLSCCFCYPSPYWYECIPENGRCYFSNNVPKTQALAKYFCENTYRYRGYISPRKAGLIEVFKPEQIDRIRNLAIKNTGNVNLTVWTDAHFMHEPSICITNSRLKDVISRVNFTQCTKYPGKKYRLIDDRDKVVFKFTKDKSCYFANKRLDNDATYLPICSHQMVKHVTMKRRTSPATTVATTTVSTTTVSTTTVATTTEKLTPCVATTYSGISWPRASVGHTTREKCPFGNSTASWYCRGINGQYSVADLDISNCMSEKNYGEMKANCLNDLDSTGATYDCLSAMAPNMILKEERGKPIPQKNHIFIISTFLAKVAHKMKSLNYQDGENATSILRKSNKLFMAVSSNLLGESKGWNLLKPKARLASAATVIDSVEHIALLSANHVNETEIVTTPNIGMETFSLNKSDTTLTYEGAFEDNWISVSNLSSAFKSFDKDLIHGAGLSFKNMPNLLEFTHESVNISNTTEINSDVVGFSFFRPVYFDGKHVSIHLNHHKTNGSNAQCVFWNTFNASWDSGFWDNRGCEVESSSENETVCICNHFTCFAVLMDFNHVINTTSVTYYVLSQITDIFLPISIVCLILTVFIFGLIRPLRSRKNMITINLCICLAIGQILLFVDARMKPEDKVKCTVVAMLLEYFLLSAFAWFLLEGYFLYKMVIKVFNTKKEKILLYYLFGYGVPILIISIAYASFPDGYDEGEDVCWLTTNRGFIWSFISPIMIVIPINLTLFILALRASLAVKQNVDKNRQLRRRIKGAITLLFLLGVTWIFGLFYFNKATMFMAYIFVILNTSQGIFIFAFQIVVNKQNRQEVIKACKRKLFKADFSLFSSSTTSMQSNSTKLTHFNTRDDSKTQLRHSKSNSSSSSS